jgi:hypothetical protein
VVLLIDNHIIAANLLIYHLFSGQDPSCLCPHALQILALYHVKWH